jgi:hypothetical protein
MFDLYDRDQLEASFEIVKSQMERMNFDERFQRGEITLEAIAIRDVY